MDIHIVTMSGAILQLGRTMAALQQQRDALGTSQVDKDAIDLQLPLMQAARNDLQHEIDILTQSVPPAPPSDALVLSLQTATADLARAIANDQTVTLLLASAGKVLTIVGQIEGK